MDKTKRFSDVPYFEIIKENGSVHIDSIFMFKGGCTELFSFLAACRETSCTVFFDNEELKVDPKEDNPVQSFVLSLYAHIAEHPKIEYEYMRFHQSGEKYRVSETCQN